MIKPNFIAARFYSPVSECPLVARENFHNLPVGSDINVCFLLGECHTACSCGTVALYGPFFFMADHRDTDFPYAKTCGICDLDSVAPFQGFLTIGRQVRVAKCVCFVSSNIFLSPYLIIYARLFICFYL